MIINITKEQLTALNPCDLPTRLKMFGAENTLDVKQALDKGASIRDILWVAARIGRKDLCIKFALLAAQRVQHLDKTGSAKVCNDALAAYISDLTPANMILLRKARAAAYAAYAAYAAADAADAAAYAAYAAYAAAAAAAYAAADAADAAAYAAYAAYAAAAAAAYAAAADAADARNKEIVEQRKILIEIFSSEQVQS